MPIAMIPGEVAINGGGAMRLETGRTYRISFAPPTGMTAGHLPAATSNIAGAVTPNIVRAVAFDDAGNLEVLIEVVPGARRFSTKWLRSRAIGGVALAVAGTMVIPPPQYTFDPTTNAWELAPLEMMVVEPTFLERHGTLLVIGGLALLGFFIIKKKK